MIKDELLHTHQLLSVIVDDLEERGIEVEEENYEDADVGPYEVFENKGDHSEAVAALAEDVNEEVSKALDKVPEQTPVQS